MASKPRRFERGTVFYFVHQLGGILTYKVISQRLSTITVERPHGRKEMPDGSFQPVFDKRKVDAKEVDWGFEWYTNERKAVEQSIRKMSGLLDYAKMLPDIIQAREELLVKLAETREKSAIQDLIRPHVH